MFGPAKSKGGVTQEVWDQLEKVYADLDTLVNMIGLDYDGDDYVCTNTDQVDPEWCDEEMLDSIDAARADLKYFLGK